MNSKDKAIAEYLKSQDIIYTCTLIGERRNSEGWVHDEFSTIFQSERGSIETPYRAGIGHRVKQKVVIPQAGGVLYCLMLDAQCAEESFEGFCGNMDYDTDSRRALDMYLACQSTGGKLRRVFSRAQLQHIEQLLEDY